MMKDWTIKSCSEIKMMPKHLDYKDFYVHKFIDIILSIIVCETFKCA